MKLSGKLIATLLSIFAVLTLAGVLWADALVHRWFKADLDVQSAQTAAAIEGSFLRLAKAHDTERINALFAKVTQEERLYAMAWCNVAGELVYQSEFFPPDVTCRAVSPGMTSIMDRASRVIHVSSTPLNDRDLPAGNLLLVHDMRFAEARARSLRQTILFFLASLSAVVMVSTLFFTRVATKSWIQEMRLLIKEKGTQQPKISRELLPVVRDVRSLVRELESDRKMRENLKVVWSPETLREVLVNRLAGDQVLIVANREPYIHTRRNDKIEVQLPASGLVSALEPILRACSGTWVAHGSGSADRDVVDEHDRVWVPPGEHSYQIRRIWLTKEEEQGYYYGFANEGLWPLCHIAHMRPIFRIGDWEQYRRINLRFAEAVVEEALRDDPIILVQDYHFALLPALIRERLPKATILTFWHIPWPNPEKFAICPWLEEILAGLLGSSVMGFHTRYHCHNFLETIDRFMESRIDWERFSVSYQQKVTAIRSYPISIEYPPQGLDTSVTPAECRELVAKRHKLPPGTAIGVGVERLDYTKGIIERFLSVERFLESHPDWRGRFTFLQIAAPSRAEIGTYRHHAEEVRAIAASVNEKYTANGVAPIILLAEHHGREQIFEYLRAANLCMVTSLHDGMNLVAKEFIAARDDELGVLILSRFTGASRELPEALIVNPYDFEQTAEAIRSALEMTPEEQQQRMKSMREQVKEYNVYRWAGRMLLDAAQIRERSRLLEAVSEWSPGAPPGGYYT